MSESKPLTFDHIKRKMKFKGTVQKVELAGARIDIGVGRIAFLHISEIRVGRRVTRVADVLEEGDQIDVWVKQVKRKQGLILLTMFEPPPLDWADLKRKMELTGKVVSIEDFGAFVDIGGPKDGLVPVSQMSTGRIEKPSDVVKVGDEVKVWVTSVNRKDNRIGLTMIAPPAVAWNEIKPGKTFTGKITRLESFGAFVDFGAEREGMIHVSEIDYEFVRDPSELLTVGQEVEAKVLDVNRRKKQIRLSIKALANEPDEGEEPEEPMLTPMEIAFHEAQAQAQERIRSSSQKGTGADVEGTREEQEAILQRTMRQHSPKP